jgi:hypothetical protein
MTGKPADCREAFSLSTQTGMREALDINMNTSLAKSLVDFAANSFASDARELKIEVPFKEIEEARLKIRAAAKADVLKAAQSLELENDPIFEALDDELAVCSALFDHRTGNDDIEAMLAAVLKFGSRHETVIGADVTP